MSDGSSIQIWRATRRGNWLVGCGVVLAVCVLILVGLGIFVAMNARGWAAAGIDKSMTAMIEQAPIDDAEKTESLAVIDGFVQQVRDGDVGAKEMAAIFQQLQNSPLLPAGMAMGIGQAYFKNSGLTDEQKAEGQAQLARMAFGLGDKTLQESDFAEVLQPLKASTTESQVIMVELNGEKIRVKGPRVATDEEVLAFIAAVRAKADEKELPPEPPSFDLSEELQRLIDAGISGEGLSGTPEEDSTDPDHADHDHGDAPGQTPPVADEP